MNNEQELKISNSLRRAVTAIAIAPLKLIGICGGAIDNSRIPHPFYGLNFGKDFPLIKCELSRLRLGRGWKSTLS
jgi:hypothetical protein